MKILFFFTFATLLVSGCVSPAMEENPMGAKTVSFQTNDHYTLVATHWENKTTTKPPIILVHQLGSDRYSFDSLAKKLFSEGFTVLSIDLRGHGDSTKKNGKTVSYDSFTDSDWKQLPQDINSAAVFLNADSPFIIGASIGANASLQYASNYPSTRGIVLLSPGINYKGLDVTSAMKNSTVSTLIIASKEDGYSAQSSQSIFSTLAISDKKLLLVENAGHGTNMLLKKPELANEILAWLNDHA